MTRADRLVAVLIALISLLIVGSIEILARRPAPKPCAVADSCAEPFP
jgi:hypothetical protein